MIYPNKSLYIISGFAPPSEGIRMGGYGFAIGLNAGFAKKCIDVDIEKINLDNLNKTGRGIILKVFGYDTIKHPFHFEDNFLLSWVSVPGNACDIGNCGIDCKDILNMSNDDFIEYDSHNVDSIKQSYCLLSLWLIWFNAAFSCIDK